MYKEATPAFELSVEFGTPNVPDDGRYHVLFQGEVIASANTERKGVALYRLKRQQLLDDGWELPKWVPPSKEEQQRKQAVEGDLRAMRSDFFVGRAKKSGAGGRGGRGGV